MYFYNIIINKQTNKQIKNKQIMKKIVEQYMATLQFRGSAFPTIQIVYKCEDNSLWTLKNMKNEFVEVDGQNVKVI